MADSGCAWVDEVVKMFVDEDGRLARWRQRAFEMKQERAGVSVGASALLAGTPHGGQALASHEEGTACKWRAMT